MSSADKKRMDARRIGALLALCTKELGWDQESAAERIGVASRTLRRWQSGSAVPWREYRQRIALALVDAQGETWRALVVALELPLDAMLAAAPAQRAKLPPPAAPPPPPTPAIDAHASLDSAVRRYAEDLDVSPRRLRLAFALLLADLEALDVSPARARVLVVHRADAALGAIDLRR